DLLNVMGPLGNGFPTPPLPPLKEGGKAASPRGEGGNAASPPEVGGNAASPLGEGGNAASPLKEGGNAASPPEVGGNAVSPPLRGGAGGERILLVGGGIGTAPLLLAARTLGKSCDALLGFATADKAILLAEFAERCGNAQITSDNGSLGRKGFVTELLSENYSAIFACGPKPMLKAVAELAKIPCYVSMEERMGCGIGACLTCVCKTTRAVSSEQRAESYSRVCKDGPVFSAEDIVWE
ncbi:MAG: hypothetical protein LBN43_03810, partial [Oscillospiraceae bacterium]|nr:hypothetical protein [Oscillospiraceae bacterium]